MRFRFAISLRALKLSAPFALAATSALLVAACGGAAPAPTPTTSAAAPSPGIVASPTRPNLGSPVPSSGSPTTSSTPAPSGPGTTYTVEAGDTLLAIAEKEYGDATLWQRIFDANKDVVSDPDALQVGMKLQIPPKP